MPRTKSRHRPAMGHWLCTECGEKQPFVSEAQRQRAVKGREMHCTKCWRIVEQASMAAKLGDAIKALGQWAPIESRAMGWMPVNNISGGYIYRLMGETDYLYIGSTEKPVWERVKQHKRQRWWPEVLLVEYLYCATLDEARARERTEIAFHAPTYNKAGIR